MATSRLLLLGLVLLLQRLQFLEGGRVPPDVKATRVSVIIIGAGMSGITAGKTLSENGVKDMLILEARDEIGGRMMTHDFGGVTIEKGANWIEGVNGPYVNPLLPIAKEIGLVNDLSVFDNITSNIYDANGIVGPEVAEPASKFIDELNESTESLANNLTETNDTDVSVLTGQRFYGRFPITPVEMALDYFHNDWEFAEPPRITSLKATQPLPTYANFGDDLYFVHDPRGYKSIVHHLANSYLENKNGTITDNRLKLNSLVNKIEYSKEGVQVTTEDGSVYTSDYAVVSVSLGVLQSTLIDFVPDLPFWKLKAIYTFDMAVYTKIFLKFPKRFWSSDNKFWLYADERRGYYPIWENLDSEFPDANVLLVTVTDEESRRIEQQPDSETLDEIMGVLKTMFGNDVPTAESIYVPKWVADPLFRGSYSNWPVGVEPVAFQQLQAPVGNIYFSGEHTSEEYSGYVHGAHLQGMAIANDLLDCKNNEKCAPTSQVYEDLAKDYTAERVAQKQIWSKKIARMEKEFSEVKLHVK